MSEQINKYLSEEPKEWVGALPKFQSDTIKDLLAAGRSFDEAAQSWLGASAANTFRMGASPLVAPKETFLDNVKKEVRDYLCGDQKYEKERAGLFGDKAPARTLVVSGIAVAIAPHLGVAAAVLAPIVALVLASLGKITLNAWCATTAEKK